jgi:diadenosine tetraphosphate (Ap4A) HIT family hydrolase
VLQESIAKIERVYKPIGYRLNIPTGELAGQNMPQHFYMRVVPKYGVIDKGSTGIREHYKAATPEQEKEIKEALSPNEDNIIAERSKVFAKLRNDKFPGYAIILTKAQLSPNINNIDQETWNQIGEVLKELMEKYETKINCHNFFIGCNLGQAGKLVEQEKGETSSGKDRDLCFTFFPKYKMER